MKSREQSIKAQDDTFNRRVIDQKQAHVLLSPESQNRKDTLKKIDSGMNDVLARIAQKNDVSIGIDIKEIRRTSAREKAIRLARIRQNISLCDKANTKIALTKDITPREAQNLLTSLGASTRIKYTQTQSF